MGRGELIISDEIFKFRTAHLILSSRQTAVSVQKMFDESPPNPKIGMDAKFRLLADLKLSEIESVEQHEMRHRGPML